jgi:hypothetical protein
MISLAALLMLAAPAWASDVQKDVEDVFEKYERVVHEHEVGKADEVFTGKFLDGEGGKRAFTDKVKTRPKTKSRTDYRLEVKQGHVDPDLAFAKMTPADGSAPATFVMKKGRDGKWRIEGTISDAD